VVRQRSFDSSSQNPKLRDVYHHQQCEAGLRNGPSTFAGVTLNV
jgi:hypothetical protein